MTVFKPTKNSFILEREQNLIWSFFQSCKEKRDAVAQKASGLDAAYNALCRQTQVTRKTFQFEAPDALSAGFLAWLNARLLNSSRVKKRLISDEKWNTKEGWLFLSNWIFNPKPQSQGLAQEAGAANK